MLDNPAFPPRCGALAYILMAAGGVDALVGRETRAHNDIDLFVQRRDYQRFVDLIADEGFSEVAASFTTEDHTVWQDGARAHRRPALASISPRMAIFCIREIVFPGRVFSGEGRIGEVEVSSIDPRKPAVAFTLGLSA